MADQAHLFGAAGRTDNDRVLAELEVDYTPVAVPVQFFLAVEEEITAAWGNDSPAPHILTPAAGSGAWARAARAVFPNAHITGIEPRASERPNGRRVTYPSGGGIQIEESKCES